MANVKITDLSAYTNPASTDVLPIVDVAADVTKKVSIQDLLKNAGSGTAEAPGFAFDGDSNTGIYRPDADQLALSTNGTGRLFIDSSGNVGIGITDPKRQFTVYNSSVPVIQLVNSTTDTTANDGVLLYESGSDFVIENQEAGEIKFLNNGSQRVTIDSSGRLLVGTSSARSNFFNTVVSPQFQIEGDGDFNRQAAIISSSSTADFGAVQILAHQKSGSIGGNTLVANGDSLGITSFQGSDGTQFAEAARIEAYVDGTPGADDMPGRLVFSVTADGSSSPTEAMRIKNSRILNFANTPVYADNAAAKTGGLVDGDVYRKSDGTLMIVYT